MVANELFIAANEFPAIFSGDEAKVKVVWFWAFWLVVVPMLKLVWLVVVEEAVAGLVAVAKEVGLSRLEDIRLNGLSWPI